MTQEELRAALLRLLGEIAPEADTTGLRSDAPIRDQLDIDSMDFLNFIIAVARELKVEVPEADYPKLGTLDGCAAYVAARLPGFG